MTKMVGVTWRGGGGGTFGRVKTNPGECILRVTLLARMASALKIKCPTLCYAMNARISIPPDDKCYLLSEGPVNLTRVWYSPFLYQTF